MKKFYLSVMSLIIIVIFVGCPKPPAFPPTDVDPEIGYYNGEIEFDVGRKIDSDNKYIIYTADGYRYDYILVVDGAFHNQWGDNHGTNCPTDAYVISGHFISPTKAVGRIRYGYDCQFGDWHEFTVEHVF